MSEKNNKKLNVELTLDEVNIILISVSTAPGFIWAQTNQVLVNVRSQVEPQIEAMNAEPKKEANAVTKKPDKKQ